MNLQEMADIVESKGLETALLENYIDPSQMEDRDLAGLVAGTAEALGIILRRLEPYMP